MSDKILVVAIDTEPSINDLGAAAAKAMPPGRRHRYTQKAKLTLKDGQVIDWTFRGLTKPKLADDIRRNRNFMGRGELSASSYEGFEDKKTHWSLCWSVRIGL